MTEGPPEPEPTPDTAPFWEASRRGELVIQHCEMCGGYQFYPRGFCARCASARLTWSAARGTGRVYACTVVHRAPTPDFEQLTPYVVAVVELDEGIRMVSRVVGCASDDVEVGTPVEVTFELLSDGLGLPVFRPAGPGRGRAP